MIRVTFAYPRVAGRDFDHDYFVDRHMPLVVDRLGSVALRLEIERGIDGASWPDASHEIVCAFVCDTQAEFEAAFFPHVEELQDDMDRCGVGEPVIQISQILVDRAMDTGARRLAEPVACPV